MRGGADIGMLAATIMGWAGACTAWALVIAVPKPRPAATSAAADAAVSKRPRNPRTFARTNSELCMEMPPSDTLTDAFGQSQKTTGDQ